MPTQRFPNGLIALHWLSLLLVAVAFASMELRGVFPRGSVERGLMRASHYSAGISVLLLTLARLVMRARWRPVAGEAMATPTAAKLVHLALYGFLLAMPLSGWLLLSAEAEPIAAWGVPLPALIAPSAGLAERFEDLHELLATLGYLLIGVHAAAALAHHYLKRDGTLSRMWPGAGKG